MIRLRLVQNTLTQIVNLIVSFNLLSRTLWIEGWLLALPQILPHAVR